MRVWGRKKRLFWPSPPSYLLEISLGVVERDVLDDFREFFHVRGEHTALNPVAQDIAQYAAEILVAWV